VTPEPSFEIKARNKMTSEKHVMSSAAPAASKHTMKRLTSVTASHQNHVPLDTLYQRVKLGQGVEEKILFEKLQCLATLKYMKTELHRLIF